VTGVYPMTDVRLLGHARYHPQGQGFWKCRLMRGVEHCRLDVHRHPQDERRLDLDDHVVGDRLGADASPSWLLWLLLASLRDLAVCLRRPKWFGVPSR